MLVRKKPHRGHEQSVFKSSCWKMLFQALGLWIIACIHFLITQMVVYYGFAMDLDMGFETLEFILCELTGKKSQQHAFVALLHFAPAGVSGPEPAELRQPLPREGSWGATVKGWLGAPAKLPSISLSLDRLRPTRSVLTPSPVPLITPWLTGP